MFFCKFCNKEYEGIRSVRSHECLCKVNPNRIKSPFENLEIQKNKRKSNQFISGKLKTHSIETRLKIGEKSAKQLISEETKKKLSAIAKRNGLGGNNSKKRLFFKKKDGKIVYLQSSYEIKFATILEELNIIWERPKPFTWIDDNGEDHKYYPDFKINNIYIDTKNDYLAVVDLFKITKVIEQNNINLKIVRKNQINKEYISSLSIAGDVPDL